jgi:small subunit ribosomal protein S20
LNREEVSLANHKSAIKRIRVTERRRVRNRLVISRARTEVKSARTNIGKGDLEAAREATKKAIRTLDKAVSKGILHRNNAARRKSRLMKRLAALEATERQNSRHCWLFYFVLTGENPLEPSRPTDC